MAYVQNRCTKEQAIRTMVDIGSFPLCSNLHIWLCSLCDDFLILDHSYSPAAIVPHRSLHALFKVYRTFKNETRSDSSAGVSARPNRFS